MFVNTGTTYKSIINPTDFVTMSDLEGKVALITGASSGIGAATAVLFARLGAKLVLGGRNEVNLQRTCHECVRVSAADAQQPLLIIADMCSEADVARLVDTTVKRFARLDILVNNAGIGEFDPIETSSLEQYDRVMSVNVRSVYQLTMLCVPHLIATRGNIVNVSSLAGTRSVPNLLVYSMSKSALDQMTRCTALELASKGVRVNSVNPAVIDTEIFTRAGMSDDDYAKCLEQSKTTHPLGRVGKVEEVAQAIAFLASTRASFILTAEDMQLGFVDF